MTVPLPRIAMADSPTEGSLVASAIQQYEAETAVVDPRLTHKVDLEMKGGDLKSLVDLLTQKSGVRFYVSRDLEDLKLTVLVQQVPLRDLMRQVVRLFDLEWHRRGEDPRYTYSLSQTLKQKLAEEELRRRDEDQMVLDVANELEPYNPYKDAPREEIQALAREAQQKAETAGTVEDRDRWLARQRVFDQLSQPRGQDAFALFARLTPDQWVALREGQTITFTSNGASSDDGQNLPPEMARDIRSFFSALFPTDPHDTGSAPPDTSSASIRFTLDHSRPDSADLRAWWALGDGSVDQSFMTGQPDALRVPGNVQSHAALNASPEFAAPVSLNPQSGLSNPPGGDPSGDPAVDDMLKSEWNYLHLGTGDPPRDPREWIDSADLFSELHRKTGRSIIADYYLRLYPRGDFTCRGRRLLDALNEAADELKSDWQPDGEFLRFRRFNYYSQRSLDVPNRLLTKWAADRRREGHLGLDSLSEISDLPEMAVSDRDLTFAVVRKWGLEEWPLVTPARAALHLYDSLSPLQRQRVQSDAGLSLTELSPQQIALCQEATRVPGAAAIPAIDPHALAAYRLYLRLTDPGVYTWNYRRPHDMTLNLPGHEDVRETSRSQASAAVAAYERAHGIDPAGVPSALRGPGREVWIRLQGPDRWNQRETDDRGGYASSDSLD